MKTSTLHLTLLTLVAGLTSGYVLPRQVTPEKASVTVRSCTQPNKVALTFDDGPYQYSNKLLDLLKERGVKATFFVVGKYGSQPEISDRSSPLPSILQRMVAEGHQVGSHTYSHSDLQSLVLNNRAEFDRQIQFNEKLMIDVLGMRPTYIRPPYGSCGAECEAALTQRNYRVVTWDLDTRDWEGNYDVARIIFNDNVVAHRQSSWLVLAHETLPRTVDELVPYMIDQARAKGYQLVTVGECLGEPSSAWYIKNTNLAARATMEPRTSSSDTAPTINADDTEDKIGKSAIPVTINGLDSISRPITTSTHKELFTLSYNPELLPSEVVGKSSKVAKVVGHYSDTMGLSHHSKIQDDGGAIRSALSVVAAAASNFFPPVEPTLVSIPLSEPTQVAAEQAPPLATPAVDSPTAPSPIPASSEQPSEPSIPQPPPADISLESVSAYASESTEPVVAASGALAETAPETTGPAITLELPKTALLPSSVYLPLDGPILPLVEAVITMASGFLSLDPSQLRTELFSGPSPLPAPTLDPTIPIPSIDLGSGTLDATSESASFPAISTDIVSTSDSFEAGISMSTNPVSDSFSDAIVTAMLSTSESSMTTSTGSPEATQTSDDPAGSPTEAPSSSLSTTFTSSDSALFSPESSTTTSPTLAPEPPTLTSVKPTPNSTDKHGKTKKPNKHGQDTEATSSLEPSIDPILVPLPTEDSATLSPSAYVPNNPLTYVSSLVSEISAAFPSDMLPEISLPTTFVPDTNLTPDPMVIPTLEPTATSLLPLTPPEEGSATPSAVEPIPVPENPKDDGAKDNGHKDDNGRGDGPESETHIPNGPEDGGPMVDEPKLDSPKSDGPVGDPKGEGPKVDVPNADVPNADVPNVEVPIVDVPKDMPKADGPQDGGPKGDEPKHDGPKNGGPKDDGPKHGGPKDDGSKGDEPKHDSPKVGGPKEDGPKVDFPNVDIPKVDIPNVNIPNVDIPKVDVPTIDIPNVGIPNVDVPNIDGPKDVPKVDGSQDGGPKGDEPKHDGPKDDGPKHGDPKGDEPKGDEPKHDGPKVDDPKNGGPQDGGPKDDGPKVEGPKGDEPKHDGPKVEGPKNGGPKGDEPKGDSPKVGGPKEDGPKVDFPKVDIPNVGIPNVGIPIVGIPNIDVPNVDIPKVDVPNIDGPKDVPKVDGPQDGGPKGDEPKHDGPKVDGPQDGGPKHDGPKHGDPKDDGPKGDEPKHDGPKVDGPQDGGPKDDSPKHGGPKGDEPKGDEPKHDDPKVGGPKEDGPKVDVPNIDVPKIDVPNIDVPKIDVPNVDGPKKGGPKDDEPKHDSPKDDGPKNGGPKGDEPKHGSPKDDGPKVDGPKVDEPKHGSPKDEGPKVEGPKGDEPKHDSPKDEGPKADGPKNGGSKDDGPKVDEPKHDSPKVGGPKEDGPKVDEPKVEGPKGDSRKSDLPKSDDTKDNNPKDGGAKDGKPPPKVPTPADGSQQTGTDSKTHQDNHDNAPNTPADIPPVSGPKTNNDSPNSPQPIKPDQGPPPAASLPSPSQTLSPGLDTSSNQPSDSSNSDSTKKPGNDKSNKDEATTPKGTESNPLPAPIGMPKGGTGTHGIPSSLPVPVVDPARIQAQDLVLPEPGTEKYEAFSKLKSGEASTALDYDTATQRYYEYDTRSGEYNGQYYQFDAAAGSYKKYDEDKDGTLPPGTKPIVNPAADPSSPDAFLLPPRRKGKKAFNAGKNLGLFADNSGNADPAADGVGSNKSGGGDRKSAANPDPRNDRESLIRSLVWVLVFHLLYRLLVAVVLGNGVL